MKNQTKNSINQKMKKNETDQQSSSESFRELDTGQKMCNYCGKKYNQSGNIKKHILETHEIPNEDDNLNEDQMKKFNLTSSQEGVSLELFDPRKKLHYLMTFWKDSKSSAGNSAIDAIQVMINHREIGCNHNDTKINKIEIDYY